MCSLLSHRSPRYVLHTPHLPQTTHGPTIPLQIVCMKGENNIIVAIRIIGVPQIRRRALDVHVIHPVTHKYDNVCFIQICYMLVIMKLATCIFTLLAITSAIGCKIDLLGQGLNSSEVGQRG